MPRLGISLVLTNIFFHFTVRDMLSTALVHDNSGTLPTNYSSGDREEGSVPGTRPVNAAQHARDREQSVTNDTSPWRKVKKCCPWGTTFDANSLNCEKIGETPPYVFLRWNVTDLRGVSIGVPDCLSSALFSVVTKDFDPSTNDEVSDYCVDERGGSVVVVTCGDPSVVCAIRPCIRKCKALGHYYGRTVNDTDDPGGVPFSPVFYNLASLKVDESVTVSQFGVLFGMECADGKIRLDDEKTDSNYLGTNGSLFAPGHRQFQVFEQNEFCLEYVRDEGLFTFLCLPIEQEDTGSVESYVLLALGFIASCVCLFATFVVYLCSWRSRSLYGKTLMFYVGCLCIAYLSLAIAHLGSDFLDGRPCILLGYSILLSFLAAFFWLNIMSIDIWKTFRSLRATDWRKAPDNRSRLIAYSIYAWGMPLAITVICGMLDAVPRSDNDTMDMIKPNIGLSSCWFSRSTYGMYIFFVAPVSMIITCNIALYVNTVWRCWKIKAEINKLGAQAGRSRGKYSVHKDQLVLNGKLFIVMGVSWGPEFLSTVLRHPLWKITDAMNTLLGVFIFIIFVLKKKTMRSLSQRVRDSLRSLPVKAPKANFERLLLKEKKSCISGEHSNTLPRSANV